MDDKPLHEKFGLSEYSIKYPVNNDAPIETWISLLIAVLTSVTIIPLFTLLGYLSRLRKASLNEDTEAPRFENYKELTKLGTQCFVAYLPMLVVVAIGIILATYIPLMIGVAGIPFFLWPIISVKFAETEDYKLVYDSEILDILSHELFIRYISIYAVTYVVILAASLTFGLITAGIGLLVFLPILVWFRAAYWGQAIHRIRKQIEFEDQLAPDDEEEEED